MERKKFGPFVLVGLFILIAIGLGGLLGLGLAETQNLQNTENFTDFDTALPSRLVDINGEVITEFASDEKREIIQLKQLPQQMIDALLTREDRIFYEHKGFSMKALSRAVIGVVSHKTLGGGSTLTQQIAGTLFCDRTDYSVMRKIKELWYAIQMERRYSKDEILELYLNKIYFGGGTYGVNAASKYYFGHGAKEITPAEAAILVIQLSNPAYYNPFENTNRAKERQKDVLDAMVDLHYLSRDAAEYSFDRFWADFDFTRTSTGAYHLRDDKAPWFSEYVRRTMNDMLYGTEDLYTGGFTVNTTLNLQHQYEADDIMRDYIKYANETYQKSQSAKSRYALRRYVPMADLCTLLFNLPSLKFNKQRNQTKSMKNYTTDINPVIDIMSMICGMDNLKTEFVNQGNIKIRQMAERNTIEGTMIALENSTGYIDALVGGSKYDSENQFIRAVQSKLQPGSTFKPLYYSAAIDSRKFTMTSTISDTPIVFTKSDGNPYIPQNFKGEWEGDVQVWYALAHSMNVPSLKVMDGVGFDAVIKRTSSLLQIPANELSERNFEPVYPLGLGVCSVRPIELCQAFATFANYGKKVTPIAIRNVEDKEGNIIKNPEKDLRLEQQRAANNNQVISPETAFIMRQMLSKTVESGTLDYPTNWKSTQASTHRDQGREGYKFKYKTPEGKTYYMPAAGKTGTTQNWADAWTVGFTPYYTAAFWFGFDRPGQSLGLEITGSTLAGVAWADFMQFINLDKPYKSFGEKPSSLTALDVCTESGGRWTRNCGTKNRVTGYYFPGTVPQGACQEHSYSSSINYSWSLSRLEKEMYQSGAGFSSDVTDTSPLVPNLDFLKSDLSIEEQMNGSSENSESNENEDGIAVEVSEESDTPVETETANWFLD